MEEIEMTDKSAFSDAEWHALTDAPLLITLAMFVTGEHGPISMVKEASASAREMAQPGERGTAAALIDEIATGAKSKEARHDMKEHRGSAPDEVVQRVLADLQPAVGALSKLPADEAAPVGAWFVDIAKAVAGAAKGVNPKEQATIEQIEKLFVPGS
jgi:hypothetical protein